MIGVLCLGYMIDEGLSLGRLICTFLARPGCVWVKTDSVIREFRSAMVENLKSAIQYWFTGIVKPVETFRRFQSNENKLQISLWIVLLFSFMYAITAYFLYRVGILPAIEPWVPISEERYYLYQAFWTIPWGLVTAIMMGGVAHIMAVLGRRYTEQYFFEDALLVNAMAWVIPSFVFMWLPETFVVSIVRDIPWPGWTEILRLAVFPVIWQVVLVVIGMRETHRVGWVRGILIAVVVTGLGFLMFLPVMR